MNDEAQTTESAAESSTDTPTRGKPLRLPRQGNVHATIFENISQNGPFFTVDLQRRYVDAEEKAHFTHSFKPTDMADVMKQAAAVQEKIAELTQGRAR